MKYSDFLASKKPRVEACGIELKESYFNQAVKNLKAAVKQGSLFAA